ncbi:UDP-glucose dehydrogenase family protein [Halalkalibacter alkalisediminis]|uniref:UDP-glucose 6-dehydrogenase n=1 Tax=Halalkalibacter alkalisediminis TaxID=935616 RepID=A0ABV6NEU9_9BACI|nr:UDP-glucose/GDP-mannose dehydrogenase family protein [Halalkalibacter alkalisediminis]
MKICVIGTGYVGLVSGVCYSDKGNQVTCVDIDEVKVNHLKKGIVPIYEPGLKELMLKNVKEGRLHFTSQIREGMEGAELIIIAVGTPAKENGEADLRYIKAAARSIGENLTDYKVIVTKSTVPVGTGQIIKKMVSDTAGHSNFDIASNPEFLREGSAIQDTFQMERAILGIESDRAEKVLQKLHEPFQTKIVVTDVETAEMTKYAANAFLATKISFINEVANLCEATGANVEKVAEGMGYDQRIGKAFLQAGIGYGGSCFPKDTQALVKMGEKAGYRLKIVPAVEEVNKEQRLRFIEKLRYAFGNEGLKGKKVAVLGLAFKPNTDDMRAAPAVDLVPRLEQEGVDVVCYDPVATEKAKEVIKNLQAAATLDQAVKDADAILILTDWQEFKEMNVKLLKLEMKRPIIIDGRNLFDPIKLGKLGYYYASVGRPIVQ